MQFNGLQQFFLWAIPMLFAITLHEVAHGWVARYRGDPTASILGRLSLNPLKHVDMWGTVIIPILLYLAGGFIFGWAKPVPVDWRNLKNPRWDMALVALAGPLSNLLMAIIWASLAYLGLQVQHSLAWFGLILFYMGLIGIKMNLMFLVLNLIPIPPLDGSRVVTSLLPARAALHYNALERYGFLILLVLLASGILAAVMMPLVKLGFTLLGSLFGL